MLYTDKYDESVEKEIDYSNAIIKEAYKTLPKLAYPGITVQELDNFENTKFTDNDGEHVSNLAYQIDAYSRSFEEVEAKDIVTLMGNRINEVLTGENYKLTRTGTPTLIPVISDKSILRLSLRYECSIYLDTNKIYKRS